MINLKKYRLHSLFLAFILASFCVQAESSTPTPVVKLAFVGDIILHERLRKRADVAHAPYSEIWEGLGSDLFSADMTYANLEGPVAPEIGGISGYPQFNYPTQIISDLKNSGFDIVSTANNHALDRGWKGVDKTIAHLREQGLAFTGTKTSDDPVWEHWAQSLPITSEGFAGKQIYFLACTQMLNGGLDPKDQVLHCFEQQDKIKSWIKTTLLKPEVVAIILLPHWGEENQFEISKQRQDWAREMIQAGAIAVVGSHPHVMQKIERIDQGVVAYSLGNFVSNQRTVENRLSLLLQLKLQFNKTSQKLALQEVKPLPLWLDRKFESDGTAKYQLQIIQDFKKIPVKASEIWKKNTI